MNLADMHPRKRRETIILAVDILMRQITTPMSTRDICARVCEALGTKETRLVARVLTGDVAPRWVGTGRVKRSETASYTRFGQKMTPYVWLPEGQREDTNVHAFAVAHLGRSARKALKLLAYQDGMSTLGSFTCLACGRMRPAQEFHDLADRRCIDCPPLRTTQGLEDLL